MRIMIATILRAASMFSALVLSGCTTEHHCSVSADFTSTQRDILVYSASQWNAVAYDKIYLDGGTCKIVKKPKGEVRAVGPVPPGAYPSGSYSSSTDTLEIIESADGIYLMGISLHEMGHMVGVKHLKARSDDPLACVEDGIMCITRREIPEITPADLTQCRRDNACP